MIEPNTFLNCDCMELMKEIPDKYFDLAIVDPPYGINVGSKTGGGSPFGGKSNPCGGGKCVEATQYRGFDDSCIPDPQYFFELFRVSQNQVIFGGNYFLDYLPKTECFIVWDKARRGLNFADCELAWTSFKQPCRIIEYKWNGMLQQNMKHKEIRIHPTQKPIELYEWILRRFAKQGDKILDTHVGSASSLIACHNLGFEYVGCELDEVYYKLACERIERHKMQLRIQL